LEDELFAEFGPQAFAIERADVDSRPEWRERYGLLIPVLLDNSGQVRSQTRLQAELLAPLLPPSGP
ncbi:UNVERIFIED_CONTAM: glutaredoxin family protein, partial [Salmonella enterica subsp. enterica serovar Weltevreden]